MSKDGYLPDGVSEKDLPGEREGHYKACPVHEDADQQYSECGGVNECFCSETDKAINECHVLELDCECDEIYKDEKAAEADAKNDRIKEDGV